MARFKITDLLRGMDIFEGLTGQDLGNIAKLLRQRSIKEGAVLFRQGDPGDSMYIVLSGRVKMWTTDTMGREKVLAFFGDGDFLGEAGVLTGESRNANAEASTSTKVLVLRKDDFDQLLAFNLNVMRQMYKVVAQRQAEANQRLAQEAAAEQAGIGSGRVFAFFSPRGGSGKSSIAVNMGVHVAQQQPDRVALMDLDLTWGHSYLMLDLSAKSSLAGISPAALRQLDKDSINYYLLTHVSSLRVIVGAMRPEDGETVTGDHVKAVADVLKRMFNVILVDTGRNFSEPTLAVLEMADQIVMVATPEATVLRDLKECQRIFFDVLGFPPDRVYWVLNQPFPYRGIGREEMERALGLKFDAEIPYAAEALSMAVLRGEPYVLRNPSAPYTKTLDRISRELQQRALEASVGFRRQQAAAVAAAS
jgi:CRP-like cAMP-binding protein/MinD-like ATPase involved in chromosome partitioning or flagellar assembly